MDTLVGRPLLVGMNNPQGNQPLWPDPPGCTGYKIWQMINEVTGCTKRQYLHAVERVNLVEGRRWCPAAARASRETFLTRLQGRTTVLLGLAVPSALGLPRPPWGSWARLPLMTRHRTETGREYDVDVEGRYVILPHPSGLNRWYNHAPNRALAQAILVEVFDEGRRALGLPLRRPCPETVE